MTDYATKLKEWRTRSGLNQEQAARAMLVPYASYQSWEQGRRKPDGDNKRRIDALLGDHDRKRGE